jgi:hypothetical protein
VGHLRDLVSLRGRLGDWPRTLAALARLDELAPGSTSEQARLIPLYLEAGDYDRYSALREEILTRGEKSTGAINVIRAVHMLSVLPSLGASTRVTKMLDFAAANAGVETSNTRNLLLAQGLAAYRAERFAHSVEALAQVATSGERWQKSVRLPRARDGTSPARQRYRGDESARRRGEGTKRPARVARAD